jgi:hypothetical protein
MKKVLTILFYPFGFVLGYAIGKGINLMNGEGLWQSTSRTPRT